MIYKNIRTEHKLIMVRRRDCVTLADPIERANDYEAYIRGKMNVRLPPTMALMAGIAHVGRKKHDSSHTTPRWLIIGRGIRVRQPGAKANTSKSDGSGAKCPRPDHQRPLDTAR